MQALLVFFVLSRAAVLPAAAEEQKGAPEAKNPVEEKPVPPFEKKATARHGMQGEVDLSDGTVVLGDISFTPGKKLALFVTAEKKYKKFYADEIVSLEVSVEKEWMAKVEKWKEGGSDEKVYTGEEYPCHRYSVTVTNKKAKAVSGYVNGAVVYVKTEKKTHKFFIRKNAKGTVGQKTSDIIYMTKLQALTPAELQKRKKELENKDTEAAGAGKAEAK